MAQGDVVSSMTAVASGAFFNIFAPANQEWVLHNIYHGGGINLQLIAASNVMSFTSISVANVETNLQFHITGSIGIRMQNTDAATRWFAFDGVQTNST